MAVLINAGSAQMPGVRRGLGRAGRRGGFLGCGAVNPTPTRSRELRVHGRREAAAPGMGIAGEDDEDRDAPTLPALLPAVPAAGTGVSMCLAGWSLGQFVSLEQGRRAVCSSVEGRAVEFSAAVWLVFNPFCCHQQRVDLLACFTQVLPGLNLKVQ